MGSRHAYGVRCSFIAIACACAIACGDDDDEPTDAGNDSEVSEGGRGGRGGSGTGAGGRGGRGGTAGQGTAGRGPTGGTGMMMTQCTEPAPTQPVVCGGQTCEAPTYQGNQCVIACCATVAGAEVCGAKSTNPMYTTGCEPPVSADPDCPDLEGQGNPLEGCCNTAQGVCGIISTLRPGCITMSSLITLPDPLQACGSTSDDAGTDDAGL
jgi:hypothetical protein